MSWKRNLRKCGIINCSIVYNHFYTYIIYLSLVFINVYIYIDEIYIMYILRHDSYDTYSIKIGSISY